MSEYNIWAVEQRKLAGKAVLVRGYRRTQVLALRAGATRRVGSLSDILDGKFSFINRNPGSGTRMLVEAKLKELASERGLTFEQATKKIQGWEIEAKSHSAVATAVASGRADAGVCVETAAVRAGLARIPIAEERFDFLVRKSRLGAPAVRSFLETLSSAEFAQELPRRVPGLSADADTGKVIWGEPAARKARRSSK
jgi:putative molybdopterin biosynthesis protein